MLILLLAVWASLLCWHGVSWAFHPNQFLYSDEISNLAWQFDISYRWYFYLLPQRIYNDRPIGFMFERILYDLFGMDYTRHLACFLLIHFANCGLIYLLFRCLELSPQLTIAAIGVFGGLSRTALTATYVGASFDVLCTFFLLGSILTYRTFYPGGTREKAGGVAGKSADSGEGSGQAANCRGETGVLPWTEAAIRCLSRSLGRPLDPHARMSFISTSRRHGGIHFEPAEVRAGIRTHGSIGKSLPGECGRGGRCAGFEGIAGLAALAPEMAQNAVHNPGLRNDGDDPQLGAARAQERVDFEDLP